MKKSENDNTIPNRLTKGFSSEDEFEEFLKTNKDYVLDILSGEKMRFSTKYVCDSVFLICSVRYAVGRKTGIVRRVVDWILDEWDRLDSDDRNGIVKEILEYEQHWGNIGSEWDREQWYRIVNKGMAGFLNEMIRDQT